MATGSSSLQEGRRVYPRLPDVWSRGRCLRAHVFRVCGAKSSGAEAGGSSANCDSTRVVCTERSPQTERLKRENIGVHS